MKKSAGDWIFDSINVLIMLCLVFVTLYPMYYVFCADVYKRQLIPLAGSCSRTMRPTIIMPGSTLIRSIRGSILQSTPAPPPSALGPITTVGCTDMTTIMPPPPACEISTRLIPRLGRRSNWEPSRPRYRIWPLTTAVG